MTVPPAVLYLTGIRRFPPHNGARVFTELGTGRVVKLGPWSCLVLLDSGEYRWRMDDSVKVIARS